MMDAGSQFLIWLFDKGIELFGWIMAKLLGVLIDVAQYNHFSEAPLVAVGWPIMRDVCNMFFIIILLIIAIGTIVKWETINVRQNLRRLILMALLINFSKTIVIFLIDFSQVIMLTFINAVKDFVAVGLIVGLNLSVITNPTTEGGAPAIGLPEHAMAFIFTAVATLVILVMVVILFFRILALWLLIVFSPLAFTASTLPQTKRWYDDWWKQLGNNLTSGPVMAFMLWLTFAFITEVSKPGAHGITSGFDFSDQNATIGLSESLFVSYAISIGLLMYSIRLAVQMGAAGGAIAQKMAGSITGTVQGYAKKAGSRIAYGKSGAGGVVGYARAGAAFAVTHPVESAKKVVTLPVGVLTGAARLAGKAPIIRQIGKIPVGQGRTLGGVTRQAVGSSVVGAYLGYKTGIEPKISKVGARVSRAADYLAETRLGRAAIGATKGIAGEGKYAAEPLLRTGRRFQRWVGVGERARQRARAAAEAKAYDVDQMTDPELIDELKAIHPFANAKQAAVSRALLSRNTLDTMQRNDQITEPEADRLRQKAIGHVMEDSGLTPEERETVKGRNMRYFKNELDKPEHQEFMKTMLVEGKNFSRLDMMDDKTRSALIKSANQVLGPKELKKFLDKLPKVEELAGGGSAVAEGLRAALQDTAIDVTVDSKDKQEEKTGKQEALRSQFARYDPGNMSTWALPMKNRVYEAGGQTKKSVDFDESQRGSEQWNKNLADLLRNQKIETIADIKAEKLEGLAAHMPASTIIAAQKSPKITNAQYEAMLRGAALNVNDNVRITVDTFNKLMESPVTRKDFEQMIQNGVAGPEKVRWTNAEAKLKEIAERQKAQSQGRTRAKAGAGQPQGPTITEEEGAAADTSAEEDDDEEET